MFLIETQLPQVLKEVSDEFNIPSVHVLDILHVDETPDQAISDFVDLENLIVVTKDSDLYYSHPLKRSPKRLLLITTGNINNRQLCGLVHENAEKLVTLFQHNSFVEMSNQGLVVHE